MVQKKKVKKRLEKRINAKQKAIANKKPSRKQKAKEKRLRLNGIRASKKHASSLKQEFKQLYPKVIKVTTPIVKEVSKEYREKVKQKFITHFYNLAKNTPGLTSGVSIDIINEKVNYFIEKEYNLKESFSKEKIYSPSKRASTHHQYVEKNTKENETKRLAYNKEQQRRKKIRQGKRIASPNRLVCIQKGNNLVRTRIVEAVLLVKDQGWKFIPKQTWKKERANTDSMFTLTWEVGRIDLEKKSTPNFFKYTKKVEKQQQKEKDIEEKTQATAVKNRRKRKNIKLKIEPSESTFTVKMQLRSPRVVTVSGNPYIIDEESKQYYEFNPAKLKELREKGNTLEDIVAKFLKKDKEVFGYCSYGDIDNPFFLNLAIENGTFTGLLNVAKEDTEFNTFLFDITNSRYYIFTKKYYAKLKKIFSTDEDILIAILSRVKKDPIVLGRYVSNSFDYEYFKTVQLPKLKINLDGEIQKQKKSNA